jgi:hypothetical protein
MTQTLVVLAVISAFSGANAQTWWEGFEHNNAALYTNLNGGPDNLTIENDIARFSGQGMGAIYGRSDLSVGVEWNEPILRAYSPIIWLGYQGVGWYSPSQDVGVSILVTPDNVQAVVHANNLSTHTVQAVAPLDYLYQPDIFTLARWGGEWQFHHGANSPTPFNGPPPSQDMHFIMYGYEDGSLWHAFNTLPEPGTFVVMGGGVALVALRRRRK